LLVPFLLQVVISQIQSQSLLSLLSKFSGVLIRNLLNVNISHQLIGISLLPTTKGNYIESLKRIILKNHVVFPFLTSILFTTQNRQLDPYFNDFDPDFSHLRTQLKEILHEETELNEIVQLVGKDSLSEDQKLSLEVARIIREDFLQQNAFSEYDYMCPLEKTIGMMRAIVTYYEGARKAIVESSSETKINWNDIHFQTKPLFTELT